MLSGPPISDMPEDSFSFKRWLQSIWAVVTGFTNLVTVTTTYTVLENIFYVRANATGGTFTVTIPAAATRDGRQILVCKVDSSGNAVTIAGTGSDTIQGSATISLAAQWNKALLISNGNNGWERIV